MGDQHHAPVMRIGRKFCIVLTGGDQMDWYWCWRNVYLRQNLDPRSIERHFRIDISLVSGGARREDV